jgi:hypothetical protein
MSPYDTIRQIMQSQGSKITSVEFVKKDGSYRKMLVQSAATKTHCVGDAASDSAKQAVETRAANYPNLLNVFDMDRKAIRSIDMDTIFSIRGGGALLFARDIAEVALEWAAKRDRRLA